MGGEFQVISIGNGGGRVLGLLPFFYSFPMPLATGHRTQNGFLRLNGLDTDMALLRTPQHLRYYAVAYRFTDELDEDYTKRIWEFKIGAPPARVASGIEVLKAVMRQILGYQTPTPTTKDYLLTAIGHADKVINRAAPLYKAGAAIADEFGMTYLHRELTKQPHEALSRLKGGRPARAAQIEAATYTCAAGAIQTRNPRVIIMDDIMTNGDTLHAIANAVMRAHGGNINLYFLALGKSERKGYWSGRGIELCNTHVPTRLANVWN